MQIQTIAQGKMFPSRRVQLFLLAIANILFVIWSLHHIPVSQYISFPNPPEPQYRAGNATLGVRTPAAPAGLTDRKSVPGNPVLSASPSWRTPGLLAAANISNLHVQIPAHPPIDPDIVNAFADLSDEGDPHPKHGASIAWLAHLDLLKHVIQSGLESALNLEDDADWDVGIRDQAVLVTQAVRSLTNTADNDAPDDAPYGLGWDILWVGSCAEDLAEGTTDAVFFDDPSVPPCDIYRSLVGDDIARFPNSHRPVFWSNTPICTFAYAVSRTGAPKVLEEVGGGGHPVFDLAPRDSVVSLSSRSLSISIFLRLSSRSRVWWM